MYLRLCNLQIHLFVESHHFSRAIELNNNQFVSNWEDTTKVFLVWGLLESDLSSCHFSEIDCIGKQKWDEEFDPNTIEAQQAIIR